jgi:hypothetical protein
MTLREHTPRDGRPDYSPPAGRLEALAAIWARQTGRAIVVQGRPGARVRPTVESARAA